MSGQVEKTILWLHSLKGRCSIQAHVQSREEPGTCDFLFRNPCEYALLSLVTLTSHRGNSDRAQWFYKKWKQITAPLFTAGENCRFVSVNLTVMLQAVRLTLIQCPLISWNRWCVLWWLLQVSKGHNGKERQKHHKEVLHAQVQQK